MFSSLKYSSLPPLLSSSNEALRYFTRHDLLGENSGSVEALWQLPAVQKFFKKQQADGS
jgi:hypothetical protein